MLFSHEKGLKRDGIMQWSENENYNITTKKTNRYNNDVWKISLSFMRAIYDNSIHGGEGM